MTTLERNRTKHPELYPIPPTPDESVRNIEKACDAANQLHIKKAKVITIPSIKDMLENPPF